MLALTEKLPPVYNPVKSNTIEINDTIITKRV